VPKPVALDIGCCPGRFTDIAVSPGTSVIASDYSSMIDAAQANFEGRNADILFVQGDPASADQDT
jgi:hypothetical protein